MPPFPKPRVKFEYDVKAEVKALREHKKARAVPKKDPDVLLVGSWNIANFGAQQRRAEDHQLLAEILSWFDVTAVQEVGDNFGGIEDLLHYMGKDYTYVMSDASGNNERMVFIYDKKKLRLLEEIGEIAFPPAEMRHVKLKDIKATFTGYDRTPYLATFKLSDQLSVLLVNVHLYFGSESKKDIERRALETVGVARWAAKRRVSRYSFTREVVALGDFNMPKAKKDGGNIVYDALTNKGLELPGHSSEVGSSIASDNHYDQVAIFPETSKNCFIQMGVYDFDQVVFRELWQSAQEKTYLGYLRYYLSDHRPIWFQMRIK